ncbi:iron complex transport system substrate-binding protein [Rhodoblastus acidophilus]|uniref:ABC transporter substrate-binding protein n=1 Tax=Rhodoblastus acidophilus TaxID=1074 RepID=UPI002223FC46|nr:ABC transporter substrate-binding protein [Rhodoblastus acidophilus]MCW2319137.1 iron complex transport system substrate-binding protein [Rhodoblastus acidophilus]
MRAARNLALAALFLTGIAPLRAEEFRDVIDAVGRVVSIPVDVQRVACLTGACYEKVFLLGEAEKIVVRQRNFPPWLEQTNPKARDIATVTTANAEELLARHVQLAFSFNQPGPLDMLTSAGIPALVTTSTTAEARDRQDFLRTVNNEMALFGDVLGPRAKAAADDWCVWHDAMVARITARTDRLPPESRPKVYYVRGPSALTTHGRESNMRWYGEMAGADMDLAQRTKTGISPVNIEDVIAWNPDVILVGRQYPLQLVTQDPRWADVAAVKSGRVIAVPDGVFFWDASSEGVLLLAFLAKTLHPDLFVDFELAAEVKAYYRKFYRYALSDAEVATLLQGRGPDGGRKNPMGN